MKKYFTLALAATFALINGMSATAGNGQSTTGIDSGEPWPSPLTFKSVKTSRTTQGFYKTITPKESSSKKSAKPDKVIAKSVSRTLNLCGSLLYSDSWTDYNYGVYTIPTNSQQSFSCLYSTPYMVNSYWESKDGKAYIVAEESFGSMSFYTMFVFDTETGAKLQTINLDNSNLVCTDLAEDPTTGDIYGCGVNSSTNSYYWRKLNFETQEYTNIAKLPGQFIGVGCDRNGQYYAMGTNTVLYKVEKTTGEMMPLYQTNIPAQYNVGGCYNDDNDTFLQTSSTDDFGRLYEIDIKTGKATMIYEFPAMEEVTNLHFQKPLADLKAPATGEFMILPTDDGSLSVEAMMTMPIELFDGTEIKSGTSLTYYIDIDGILAKTGKANAGEDVVTTVVAPSSGIHTFAFYTENEVGKSPKAYDSCYVGSAVPNAPEKATLSITNNTATISWEAVSETITEGYFDASKIKYAVFDADGKQVVGPIAGLSTTIDKVTIPDKFTVLKYSVAALMNDAVSEHTPTNGIIFGYMETPCEIDAREQDFYDSFKIIDSNNDGCSWIFDGYNTGYTNTELADDKKVDANDWLITNGIYLKANHYYNVSSVFTTTSWSGAQEIVDIMCGLSQVPEAMTIAINPDEIVSGFSTVNGVLSVPTDGVYYLGYHVKSSKDQQGLSLQWINISEGVSFTAPKAPENLKGEADVDGDPKATLTFTFPGKTMEGKDINGALKMAIYSNKQLLKEVSGNASETATAEVTVSGTGQFEFELKAVNAAGEAGSPATVKVNIGPRKPGTPGNVTAYQDKENGKILITWNPVTTDTSNKTIKEEYITYNIHFANGGYVGDLIESGVKGNSYTFDSGLASGQEFYQFVIIASNRGVTGTGAGSYQTPTGIPYTVPFSLSHQDDIHKYIVAESVKNTELGFVSDQQNIASADGDGQFIGMVFDKYTSANGTYGRIYTGLVKLEGINPTLSFYVYKFGSDDDNYSTCGIILNGKYTQLMKVNNSSLPNIGWNKVSVSLDNYGGRLAQLDFRGYYNGKDAYKLYAIDAFSVTNVQRYDIEASLEVPESVEPGESFTVKAKATNVGSSNTTSYTLSLYRGEELLKSVKNTSLSTNASVTISATETLNVTDPTNVEYKAVVVYEMDRNKDNDVASVNVVRNLSKLQGIGNLTAVRDEDGKVKLDWDYAATASGAENALKGFNIYADGVKLNNAALSETTYTHDSAKTMSYQVSALYQNGESELSEAVTPSQSGITGILCGNVKVSVDGSQIKIENAEYRNVTIVAADGTIIYSERGNACVSVASGVYMVSINGQTLKLIVR